MDGRFSSFQESPIGSGVGKGTLCIAKMNREPNMVRILAKYSWRDGLRSGSCAFHMYNQTTVEKQMLSLQPEEAVSVEGIQDTTLPDETQLMDHSKEKTPAELWSDN